MATPARIISSTPTHQGTQAVIDDRQLQRWLWMGSVPISLADWSGSRFVGRFENDMILPKRLVVFRPGHAVALGVYEFPAMVMHQEDQGVGVGGGSFLDGIAPPSSVFDQARRERLTRYVNAPKLCAYMLMKEYERRGLALFEHLRGMDDDAVSEIYELVLPAKKEAEWSQVTRTILEYSFQGPFLDQIREWLGQTGNSPMLDSLKARGPKGPKEKELVKATAADLRAACNRAWSYENASLNSSEQQIRRYRNGKLGKEFYDMPDERYPAALMSHDLLCLADTGRTPIDLEQVKAAQVMSDSTQEVMMRGMETFADRFAQKMQPNLTVEQVDAIIEKRLQARDVYWQNEIKKVKAESKTPTA